MSYEERRQRHVSAMIERAPAAIARLGYDAPSLAAEREHRLRRLVSAAAERSPWHRARLDAVGLDGITITEASLRSLPTMTKADLMDEFDRVVTDARINLHLAEKHLDQMGDDIYLFGEYHVCASGGTSGRRGVFVWDWDGWVETFLGMARRSAIRALPVPPPHRMVSVAGGSPVHMSSAITRTFSNPDRVIVRVPATEPFEKIVATVQETQPHILQGYPSMLHRLALEAAAGRLSIAPVEVLGGSEVLSDETRTLLVDVWGAPVGDLYATTDVGAIASTCERDNLHLCDDLVIVEVVDQAGEPVPDGTEGDRLVVTGLVNHALPLLRYELDDRVTISPEPCPCGSAHRVLRSVGGRTADVFTFGEATVHPATLSGVLAGDRQVSDWRATRVPAGLTVDVVPLDAHRLDADDVAERLRSALARAGVRFDRVSVQVRVVPEIERPPSGKAKRYVTEG